MSLSLLFYCAGGIAIGSAIFVVLIRNEVYSAISLVLCFFSLAVIYLLLEAFVIAVLEIFIYAGAIMVLFLFVIMLLNLGREDANPNLNYLQRATSLLLVLLFFVGIFLVMVGDQGLFPQPTEQFVAGVIYPFGEALFSKFLLPFEVSSLLLLVALIGTVYLAKRKI